MISASRNEQLTYTSLNWCYEILMILICFTILKTILSSLERSLLKCFPDSIRNKTSLEFCHDLSFALMLFFTWNVFLKEPLQHTSQALHYFFFVNSFNFSIILTCSSVILNIPYNLCMWNQLSLKRLDIILELRSIDHSERLLVIFQDTYIINFLNAKMYIYNPMNSHVIKAPK